MHACKKWLGVGDAFKDETKRKLRERQDVTDDAKSAMGEVAQRAEEEEKF